MGRAGHQAGSRYPADAEPAQAAVQQHAHAVQVGAVVDGLAGGLLGGQVVRGAADGAVAGGEVC